MRKKKVWVLMLVCVLLVLSTAACNGGKVDVTKLDPDALLKEFIQKLNDIQSGSVQAALVLDATAMDEDGGSVRTNMDIQATVSAVEKPSRKAKLDVKIVSEVNGEKQDIALELYLIEENGQMRVYFDAEAPLAIKEEIVKGMPFKNGESLGPVEESDVKPDVGAVMDYLKDPVIIGQETVDGKETIHMQAGLDISKPLNQAQEEMQESGMTAEQIAGLSLILQGLDIRVDLWMDAAAHDPVKVEIDLGSQLNSIIQMLLTMQTERETAVPTISKLELKLTLTDLNAVQGIEVPADLKTAGG